MQKLVGMTLLVLGLCGAAAAQAQTPEIDGVTAGAALALISGAILVIRARKM